jgi:hypothetical protein
LTTKELPFHVVLARQRATLSKSALVRHEAFQRHLHPFAIENEGPQFDNLDESAETVVFMAKCKMTGEPLGSARVTECNDIADHLSPDEEVPSEVRGRRALLFSRLAVSGGERGRLVRAALGKAVFLYSIAKQCQIVFVAPPRERLYYKDGFRNILPNGPLLPYRANSGVMSRILFIETWSYQNVLENSNTALHNFIFAKYHPDLLIFDSISGSVRMRRSTDVKVGTARLSLQDSTGVLV